VSIAEPIPGAIHQGRLVGFARDRSGRRHAVVDTGRELTAFRTEDTASGRDVKVQGTEHEDDRKRRVLVWRLGDDEHQRERAR
jgi:hypothetical protein